MVPPQRLAAAHNIKLARHGALRQIIGPRSRAARDQEGDEVQVRTRIDWRVIVLVAGFTAACGTGSGGIGAVGCSIGSQGSKPPAATANALAADRKYLLETVDDAAVIQLYADGFSALPLREKTLVWHLYQAALAGRDIFLDQKHRNALEMRAVIEAVVAYPQGVDPGTLTQVQRYAKLFWINNGPYNNLTAQKFLLQATPEALAGAVKTAVKNGAAVRPARQRVDRRDAGAAEPHVLRRGRRSDRHGQDAATRQGHPDRQRQQPLCRRHPRRPQGLHREVRAQLPPGEAERPARRGGVPRRRPLLEGDHRDRHAPRGGNPLRHRADGQRAACAGAVLPHGREGRPREVRHRVGERQGLAGGHHQRIHRGVPRPARHQRRLGGTGLLRQPGEDRADPEVRRQRAVVRGPHAVRRQLPQADGDRHRGQRHRRRDRDGRLGTRDADRDQPAQRPGDPRAPRQQVGDA